MDKRISIGAHVMYKDGENWREGVVESKSAIGVIMVRYVLMHVYAFATWHFVCLVVCM